MGLAETAAAFGVSERELVDDLNLLWCVELRAPDPYCPIDLSYEGGEIVVSQAESIGRPLRLAVDEASALLVALRMLAEVPGLEDRSALSRLIAKLEAAAGEAASASAQVAVQVDIPDDGAGRVRRPDPRRAVRRAAAAPAVLRARPGRSDRARRRPDAAARGGGAALPGGLVPSRRGGAAVPAGPGARRSRCSTCPPRRRPRPSPGTSTRACSGRRPMTCRWSSSCPPRAAGWPSTTRASR